MRKICSIYALAILAYTILSQFMAQVAPFRDLQIAGTEGFIFWLDKSLAEPFRDTLLFGLAYSLSLLVMTICWIAAYKKVKIEEIQPSFLFKWSAIFAGILVLATPIIVEDFWLSVGWGMQVAQGSNPYYVEPRQVMDVTEIPVLPWWVGGMTYGPLWALISGLLSFPFHEPLLIALAFKLFIAAAWVASVWLVWKLTSHKPLKDQCMAIIAWGFCPLALIQAVGDGHNDIAMIVPILAWIYWIDKKPVRAGLALTCAMLVKYIAAPLFALHIARLVIERKWRALAISLSLATVLTLAAFAVFYRSTDFFAPMVEMKSWKFFTPAIAMQFLTKSYLAAKIVNLLIITAAGWAYLKYLLAPSEERFRTAALWIISGILFGVVGHVWPWFLLWPLALAALQPNRLLGGYVLALSIPMSFVFSTTRPGIFTEVEWRAGVVNLVLYGGALLLLALKRKHLDR
jgi:hypothetical protein